MLCRERHFWKWLPALQQLQHLSIITPWLPISMLPASLTSLEVFEVCWLYDAHTKVDPDAWVRADGDAEDEGDPDDGDGNGIAPGDGDGGSDDGDDDDGDGGDMRQAKRTRKGDAAASAAGKTSGDKARGGKAGSKATKRGGAAAEECSALKKDSAASRKGASSSKGSHGKGAGGGSKGKTKAGQLGEQVTERVPQGRSAGKRKRAAEEAEEEKEEEERVVGQGEASTSQGQGNSNGKGKGKGKGTKGDKEKAAGGAVIISTKDGNQAQPGVASAHRYPRLQRLALNMAMATQREHDGVPPLARMAHLLPDLTHLQYVVPPDISILVIENRYIKEDVAVIAGLEKLQHLTFSALDDLNCSLLAVSDAASFDLETRFCHCEVFVLCYYADALLQPSISGGCATLPPCHGFSSYSAGAFNALLSGHDFRADAAGS